ncbi:MAG: PHB depolymerase family esterase [Chloroflexia bacterium]
MNDDTELNLTHMLRPALERDAPGAPVPGLLLLHGLGADEADLMGLEGALDPRFIIVSPRAPYRMGPGWAWYGMPRIGMPDAETFLASLAALREFIAGLPSAYGIDPVRLYVLGFSQGAILGSVLAMSTPEAVRGVVMHSGYVPQALGNVSLDITPEGLAGKPFFVAHGKYDDVLPVSLARDSHEYLQEAGADVLYQEYPIGHSIGEESLYDLSEWLTRQLD